MTLEKITDSQCEKENKLEQSKYCLAPSQVRDLISVIESKFHT